MSNSYLRPAGLSFAFVVRNAAAIIGVLLGTLAFAQPTSAQQSLDVLRSEVSTKDTFQPLPPTSSSSTPSGVPNSSSSSSSHGATSSDSSWSHGCDNADAEDALWGFGLMAAGYLVSSPVWAPIAVTQDDCFSPKPLLRFPYADNAPGYIVQLPEAFPDGKWWSLQASLEYDATFVDLQRASGEILFSTQYRFDFDFQGNELWENNNGHTDSLFFSRTNFLYRFAENEYVQFRTGFGLNWLVDEHDAAGFNFHYGVQIFPIKKLVITSDMDWGTLGNAPVWHGRMTIGVQRRELELFTGYDFQHIGGVDFSGPIAGCRVYF